MLVDHVTDNRELFRSAQNYVLKTPMQWLVPETAAEQHSQSVRVGRQHSLKRSAAISKRVSGPAGRKARKGTAAVVRSRNLEHVEAGVWQKHTGRAKRASATWESPSSPRKQKCREDRSNGKVMLVVFYDTLGTTPSTRGSAWTSCNVCMSRSARGGPDCGLISLECCHNTTMLPPTDRSWFPASYQNKNCCPPTPTVLT